MNRRWYDYLWIASAVYLLLGFINILFAWLGLLCFFIPLLMAAFGREKAYCNRYCGRGQLFSLLGGRFGLSRNRDIPKWMRSKGFRYGFLIFFLVMFLNMLLSTYLVLAGSRTLGQAVTLLWTFKLPWHWAYHGTVACAVGSAVRVRFLQRDAHLDTAWAYYNGALQAPFLVRLLPNGHHDAADLQGESQNLKGWINNGSD